MMMRIIACFPMIILAPQDVLITHRIANKLRDFMPFAGIDTKRGERPGLAEEMKFEQTRVRKAKESV